MLWIAGGIGITPFLSLATHESLFPTGRNIHLIWVIRNQTEAFHDKELHAVSKKNKNFHYIHWFSDKKGRITAKDVVEIAGGSEEVKNRLIMMCGPPAMMYSLGKGLKKFGIPYRHIIFEDFNMLD
jgi:predicted ferric reductase